MSRAAVRSRVMGRLRLPVICAPMFTVTGPALVTAAARAGIIAALPRGNARDLAEFDAWLAGIREALNRAEGEGRACGPVVVNLSTRFDEAELDANLAVCRRHGVEIIITATGDPSAVIRRVHDWGGIVLHDVVNLRFAEKAIAAGADGLNCIGAGGGGHSGTLSHLALVPRVRAMFDGLVTMAGAVGTGAAVRAGEVLGADLAYMGTRFIASAEADADPAYKRMLVDSGAADLIYTPRVAVTAANWLKPSLRQMGLDPDALPQPGSGERYAHLPPQARPWKTIWSAGQGIELIDDIPPVATLVDRIEAEYRAACRVPAFGGPACDGPAHDGPACDGPATPTPAFGS